MVWVVALTAIPALAAAHVSERALVMLLPTTIYIRAGAAAVALTVMFTIFVRPAWVRGAFRAVSRAPRSRDVAPLITSLASTAFLMVLLWQGVWGTRDPLGNPLPLVIWSVWWILLPPAQALIGDIWSWINPWRGVLRLLPGAGLHLPDGWGHWPAFLGFVLFAAFMTADPAPADPTRLAIIIGLYWSAMLAGAVVFGEAWLARGEGLTVAFSLFSRLAPLSKSTFGAPGHRIVDGPPLSPSVAALLIALLATSSFDGLNGTFTWLALIGINPLEFPGKSAVIRSNLLGLAGAIATLAGLLALAIWAGLRLARARVPFGAAFCALIPSIIPIAIGYHIAHYLTIFLVGAQYAALAVRRAAGAADFFVTTGFFNSPDSVQRIWLIQAGAIVIAHMLAVGLAHAVALRLLGSHRQAVISQLPMAVFMIGYTVFGLWILAQPTGA